MLTAVLAAVTDRWPPARTPPAEVSAAIDALDLAVSPATAVVAADLAGLLLATVVLGGSLGADHPSAGLVLAAVAGLGPPLFVRRGAAFVVALRRTRALGDSVGLVSRLVLALRLEPNLERAVVFAAAVGSGPLAASLGDHERRARGTPETGLAGFVAEWRGLDPSLARATALLESAVTAQPADRDRALDRALEASLAGTRDRLADFVSEVRGPATALYAFGVLLPLALVGVLPAARAAGVDVPMLVLVVLYDGLLPLGLLAGGLWLVARRPVAFPPPVATFDHPDAPDSPVPAVALGLVAGLAAWFAFGLVVPWTAPIGAVAVGVGVPLAVGFRPVRAAGKRAAEVDAGLPDALTNVGRRVAAGQAVETAVAAAADDVPGATGARLAAATRAGRTVGVDLERAVAGDHEVVPGVAGSRTREAAALLGLAAREGRPVGDVLVATARHLDDLRRLEVTARRELAAVTDTLANTAVVFGPLVGGVTVAVTARLAAAEGSAAAATDSGGSAAGGTGAAAWSATSFPVADLGMAVGGYVLAMAVLLTALATVLNRGLDPATLAVRVGVALPAAAVTFVVAVVAGGLLV